MTRDQIRAEMAKEPGLLELADTLRAMFGEDVKLNYLKTNAVTLGKREWQADLERQKRTRVLGDLPKGSVWHVYRYAQGGA